MLGSLTPTSRGEAVHFSGELHGRGTDALGTEQATDASTQVLAAWRRRGPTFGRELNGVFALALQCGDDRVLFRDPSSLQNLFWCPEPDGRINFSSELPALLASTHLPKSMAPAALHEYLRFLDIAAPRTIYQGVSALEAGELLVLRADGSVVQKRPPLEETREEPESFSRAVDRLQELLRTAVERRLDDSRHPALFLSSGVDSTLMAAIAADVRPDITAVTVGFDAAGFDEAPRAAAIAARLRLTHQVLRFDRAAVSRAFDRCSAGMEQPTADPSLPSTVLALDHCRSHFDVVLDGTGADEVVGAMPPRHLRWATSLGSRVPAAMRPRVVAMMRSAPVLARYAPLIDFEHPADPYIRWGGFSRPEIERLCGQPVSLAGTHFYRTFERFPRGAHFERYSALVDAMPCERVNQAMRVAGMRMRFPFLDLFVARFIRQLPVSFRDVPGQPKRLLRALLARYLPREVWDLPKRGFNFPLLPYLMADDARLVRDRLDPAAWRRRGLIDAEEVSRLSRAFLAGDQHLTFRVWALAVLGGWLEQHDELH